MKEYLRLYLIADYLYFDKDFYRRVELAIRGGVTAVQFRFKSVNDDIAFEIAKNLKDICSESGVPFFINNRPDFALILDADGVHLGQEDLPVNEVRKILPGKIIGVSAGSLEEITRVKGKDFDYISFGSVFATPTKVDAGNPIGLNGLKNLVDVSSNKPKIAIGGITLENVESVIGCGVDGVAIASAIMKSDDPEDIARKFRDLIEKAIAGK